MSAFSEFQNPRSAQNLLRREKQGRSNGTKTGERTDYVTIAIRVRASFNDRRTSMWSPDAASKLQKPI
jgi:hypothetical protein